MSDTRRAVEKWLNERAGSVPDVDIAVLCVEYEALERELTAARTECDDLRAKLAERDAALSRCLIYLERTPEGQKFIDSLPAYTKVGRKEEL